MSPLRAIIVEPNPSVAELFKHLLMGWSLVFVSDPAEIPPGDLSADLLVIDEDRPAGNPIRLEELPSLPIIILGRNFGQTADETLTLLLPKPFPVPLFRAFVRTVEEQRGKPV